MLTSIARVLKVRMHIEVTISKLRRAISKLGGNFKIGGQFRNRYAISKLRKFTIRGTYALVIKAVTSLITCHICYVMRSIRDLFPTEHNVMMFTYIWVWVRN